MNDMEYTPIATDTHDTPEAAIARAYRAVDDLCQGRLRWEMRVPAEADHDPDLIITNALRLAEAEIARLRAALAEIVSDDWGYPLCSIGEAMADIARAALAPQEASDD